jgi:AcrR family transcriptional regulator
MERSTARRGAHGGAGRTGRPPLSERRRATTRLEIAREAVRLFTTRGIAGTSAEEVAAAAGISVRTLWRYFPSKESCVLPLLTAGIETAARALRTWPPGRGVTTLLDGLEQAAGEAVADVPALLDLVRLTRTEPGLRAIWMQAHDDAEPAFATALAARTGDTADSLQTRVQAAVINAALRVGVEHYAWYATPQRPDESYRALIEVIRSALLTAALGLPA